MKIESFTGKYRFLSNFTGPSVMYMGRVFPTVEHAYQAAKCPTIEHLLLILGCHTAGHAKRVGQQCRLRDGWEEIKIEVMRDLLKQKFDPERRPHTAKLLVDTHPAELIEGNWWGDTFWGVCRGQGQNQLGKLLMEIRDQLRNGASE